MSQNVSNRNRCYISHLPDLLCILASNDSVSMTELCLHVQCVYRHISNLINLQFWH